MPHNCVLTLAQTREQHDLTAGKSKRVTASVQIVFLHFAEPSRRFSNVRGRKDAKRRDRSRVREAGRRRAPFRSRGPRSNAKDYRAELAQHGLKGSMGPRGNPYDNAKAESFIKTLKFEVVYLMEYETFDDVAAFATPHRRGL